MEDESVPSGRTVLHRFELQSQVANGAPWTFWIKSFKFLHSYVILILLSHCSITSLPSAKKHCAKIFDWLLFNADWKNSRPWVRYGIFAWNLTSLKIISCNRSGSDPARLSQVFTEVLSQAKNSFSHLFMKEYFYFSANFRPKIFLWIFLDSSEWLSCFRIHLVSGWC